MQSYMQNGTYINNMKPQVQSQPQAQPNYAGVHISIINPMVNPVTGAVTYPTQTNSAYDAGTQGGCYPSTYYTTQPGVVLNPHVTNPNSNNANGNTPTGFYDASGKYHPYVKDANGQTGYIDDNGAFVPLKTVPSPNGGQAGSATQSTQNGGPGTSVTQGTQGGQTAPVGTGNNGFTDENGIFRPYVKDANGQVGYYDDKGAFHPVDSNTKPDTAGEQEQAFPNGFIDKDGRFRPYMKNQNGQIGYYDDKGVFHPVDPNNNPEAGVQAIPNGFTDKDGKFRPYIKDANGQIGYYDDNGVFHPVDPYNNPDAIQNTDSKDKTSSETTNSKETNTQTTNSTSENSEGNKTTTKKIVKLDDDYIKTVENYLNSQDTEVRKMGAKEVADRLMEDSSRKDDPALTALVNKMLQDPSSAIRAVALSLLESRSILGNDLTVKLLKNMQSADSGYGMDSIQATSALLKMAGKVVEKEVPVEETKKK